MVTMRYRLLAGIIWVNILLLSELEAYMNYSIISDFMPPCYQLKRSKLSYHHIYSIVYS